MPPRTPTSSSENLTRSYANNQTDNLPIYFKLSWLFCNISLGACPVVTVVYWSFLYQPGTITGMSLWLDIAIHLLGTIALILDVCISAFPLRLAHMVYPLIYGLLYILFSLLYCYLGGAKIVGDCDIYPVLNWEFNDIDPTLGYIALCFVFFLLGFSLYYLMYRIRLKIYYRCYSTDCLDELPVRYANENNDRYIVST